MNRLILYCFALFSLTGIELSAQTADFSASPLSGCAPLAVSFSDNSSGTITTYAWNLGNATTASSANPSTTYANPGTYTVSLTVTGPSGTNTKSETITVYDKPAVSFTASSIAGCAPHGTQFTSSITANAPGGVSYAWDFGDGNNSSAASPYHTYNTAGTYTVSLSVTNSAGCLRTMVQTAYITAYPKPVASFSAGQTVFCAAPATVNFTNNTASGTTPYSTAWTFGDGGTGTGNTPSHTYTAGGSYRVKVDVTDAKGCRDTAAYDAYITVVGNSTTFTSPVSACEGASVPFVNTTTGSSTTSWDMGDGFIAEGSSYSHFYGVAGTYVVTMTTNIGSCTKTSTKNITINPRPKIAFAQSPSVPCPAPVTVSWTFTGSGAASYQWRWDSGGTATGPIASKHFTRNIRDRVTLIATSAAGCVDSLSIDTVYIRDIFTYPTGYPSPLERENLMLYGCKPFNVFFDGLEVRGSLPANPPAPPPLYPVPMISWRWHFGDGDSSHLQNPPHIYRDSGTFITRVIVTTQNGCIDTGYKGVHADVKVVPSFTISPLRACVKTPITFTNTTPITPDLIIGAQKEFPDSTIEFNWSFGIDSIAFLQPFPTFQYAFNVSDSIVVTLTTNHLGCRDTAISYKKLIIDPSSVWFRDSVLCPPSKEVLFVNRSRGATSQTFEFGDGTSTSVISPAYSHVYPDTGVYYARMTNTNSIYGCRDTMIRKIKIYGADLDFGTLKNAVCHGEDAFFYGKSAIPILLDPSGYQIAPQFKWKVDSVSTGFAGGGGSQDLVHRFLDKGLHTVVMYTKNENGCIDSVVKKDVVLVSRPDVRFSIVPPIGCMPLAAQFTDTSRHVSGVYAASRSWSFGDGDSLLNSASPYHTYADTGRFTVRLTVTDNQGCADSLILAKAVVVRKPVAAFAASKDSACTFQNISFASTSRSAYTRLKHFWTFGDGDTSSATNPVHRYSSLGSFSVTLIVTDSIGCSDTLIRSNYVVINAPVAAFSASARLAICPPLQVTFSNSSTGADKYAWTFGTSGGPVSVSNPVTTFSTPGLYNIRLIATDTYGCTDTASDTVRVLGYDGAFTYSPLTGCAPLTVTFLPPTAGIPSITWDFADGTTATSPGTSVTHTYTTAGPFLPKAIFSDGPSCSSLSTGADTIRIDRITADFTTSVPCVGVPFSITQTASALFADPASFSFAWSFPPTGSASGPDTAYFYNTPGNHPVTLVVSGPPGSGCADTITKQVFVNPLPIVKITGETAICPGTSDTLTASGAKEYIWAVPAVPGAASLSCTACNPTVLTPASDTSWVYLSGTDDKGCVNRDSARIIIQIKTELSAGDGGEICIGDSFRLVASGGTRYTWTPAATLDSPLIASPLASPLTTTTYTVAAQKSTCLVDSQRITVVVRPRPVFSAGQDGIMAIGGAVTLIPSGSSVVRVAWRADTTLSCTDCFRPVAHPAVTTTYYATGYNEWGCESTDSVTVIVRCNGDRVFVPNTFTPNGDGLNDRFYPRGDGVGRMSSFRVYNRWGELVYERSNVVLNDEGSGWDGSYKGKALPPDVYVYTMQARCDNGEVINYKGDIAVVK